MNIYIKKNNKLYKWNKNKFKQNIKKLLCYVSTYIIAETLIITASIYILNNCITTIK